MRFGFWVFAATCASNAAAQVPPIPENSIALYGFVHPQLELTERKGGTSSPIRQTRLTDQSSRFGVRGREDIGGGLTAWFQLETGFSVDDPNNRALSNTFATRNSGVGLHSSLGTIIVGRWDSVYNASQVSSIDPFQDIGLAAISGAAANQGNFARRDPRVLQYLSPRGPGWRSRWSYQVPEEVDGAKPRNYGAGIAYVDEVTYFAAAYEKHKDQLQVLVRAGSDQDGRGVALSHRFGPLKIAGQYGIYRGTLTTTQNSYMVAFESVHGAHELLGTYQNSRNGGLKTALAQPSCDLVGAGYRYRFSRQTFLMAQYARVDNHVGNRCNFGGSGLPITAGEDLRGFGLGMRVSF